MLPPSLRSQVFSIYTQIHRCRQTYMQRNLAYMCVPTHIQSETEVICAQTQSYTGLQSVPRKSHMCPHNHTCISRLRAHTHTHTHTHTETRFRGHMPIFTSCLHHAQLGCERMHFWQEGAGWQDPGRDRLGSLHIVASCGDELLASNSLSPLLRASRKTRTIDKATMVCNRI